MGDVNPFIKYIMKDEKDDIMHSSAYARAQNGGSMGAASSQSFADRQKLERNRQVIQGYGASRLANGSITGGPRAKAYTPPAGGAGNTRAMGPRPVTPKPLGISPKR